MAKVIIYDFVRKRRVKSPFDILSQAEEDILPEDIAFYQEDENRALIRKACLCGKRLMRETGVKKNDVMPTSMAKLEQSPIRSLCEIIMESDARKWSMRPNFYGAVTLVLWDRYKKLFNLYPQLQKAIACD